MRWCVFYVDGSTFDSSQGQPEDAPGGGVLAVAQESRQVGAEVHQRSDFYLFDECFEGWMGVDYFGFAQYLMQPGTKIVKLGEAMSTERYRELLAKIRANPNLPSKSARYPWEPANA